MQTKAKNIIHSAISIALYALSAYVTLPFGPVPFTLQTFAITLVVVLFRPQICFSAYVLYLLMGAIGIPVFSAMRGGVGVLLGATGGFLWGYAISIVLCSMLQDKCIKKISNKYARISLTFVNCVILTLIAYICGTIQYSVLANITILAASATTVVPFIIPDLAKIIVAIICGEAISKYVRI